MEINKDTTLKEILKIKGAREILSRYQLPCLYCPLAKIEMGYLKLGEICKLYGININKLLKDLNRINIKNEF